jgi:hypothetical protein
VRDAMTRAEEVLKKIGGMMQEWEGVEMEVTEHDFYVCTFLLEL